ncbi:MAG: ABC transporter permease, partial [Acidobacteriota bacterium]
MKLRDVRTSLRRLGRRPGVTIAVVLCLALGIGATTAVFSLVDGILLRDLPFRDPDRIVAVWGEVRSLDLERQPASGRELLDYQELTRSFDGFGAFRSAYLNFTGQDRPERLLAARASAGLFSVLGVEPALGRAFGPEEVQEGRDRVVVLSHGLWRRSFGGDAGVIGEQIRLNDLPYTVIGVMPRGFRLGLGQPYEIWVPLVLDRSKLPPRDFRGLSVLARLAPGVDPATARAEMDTLARRFERAHPDIYPSESGFGLRLVPISDEVLGDVGGKLFALFGLAGLVLLIACVNVINLMLAQATVRSRELALRSALGATRLQLIRGLLAESLTLALLGGGAGLLLAAWGVRAFTRINPEAIPRLETVSVDLRVLGFTVGVSVLVGLVAGLVPALKASRPDLQSTFKEGEDGRASAGSAGRRLRGALVLAEVAVATLALVGAGLMIRSYLELRQVHPGFDAEDVLTFQIFLSPQKYPERHLYAGFYSELLERLGSVPGVEAVGTVNELPLGSRRFAVDTELEGHTLDPGETKPQVDWRPASPGYFEAMDIPLLQGRTFRQTDDAEGAPVAVVDRSLAERYWPDQNPVGRRLKLSGRPGNVAEWRTVVGVVDDVKALGLESSAREHVYTPYLQATFPFFAVVLEADGDPSGLVGDVRNTVWSIDGDQPIEALRPMQDILADSLAGRRSFAWLMGAVGLVALLLVTLGVYGVVAYSVTQRSTEIGIRMALGAERWSIVRMVVGQSVKVAALGVLVGGLIALGLSRAVSDLLFGVGARDPVTFTVVALL